MPPQREQPQSETGERSSGLCPCPPLANADVTPTISTVVSYDTEAPDERPLAGDPTASSFPLESGEARDDPTHQLGRGATTITLHSPRSQPVEPDVSLQIDGDEPGAPPRQEQPQSLYTKFDRSRSIEVDHVLSIFGGKNGFKQLLQLEPDQAQYYADILDVVRYPIKLALQLI